LRNPFNAVSEDVHGLVFGVGVGVGFGFGKNVLVRLHMMTYADISKIYDA
jgi:hypothetical protein